MTAPTESQTPATTEELRRQAESRFFPYLSADMKTLIEAQPWFQELTPKGLDLVAAIQKCERAALARGEKTLPDMLSFASEQWWYRDGLDDRELTVLAGSFAAYQESLSDDNAPPIGPLLASTLRRGLFDVVALPETGDMVVLVSADNQGSGERALWLTVEALPQVEALVGAFPYKFLHIQVTSDLPEHILGVSIDQFIGLRADSVDRPTAVHEITHSTLYGIFPLWFEEGLAHFIQSYLTDTIDLNVQGFNDDLRLLSADARLDLRPARSYSYLDEYVERAQGFLFIKGLYDVVGIEALSRTIRTLRTRTYTPQELLRALADRSPTELQPSINAYLCARVLGSTRDFCSNAP